MAGGIQISLNTMGAVAVDLPNAQKSKADTISI